MHTALISSPSLPPPPFPFPTPPGGHYYAFICPDGKSWYRFDDERVTKEDARAAVEDQYGGDDDAPPMGGGLHGPFNQGTGGGGFKLSKLSNAYMLVYVRVSQWDNVMCRVTKDDIPQYLRERLEVRGPARWEAGEVLWGGWLLPA